MNPAPRIASRRRHCERKQKAHFKKTTRNPSRIPKRRSEAINFASNLQPKLPAHKRECLMAEFTYAIDGGFS